jgi:hypothetical protein
MHIFNMSKIWQSQVILYEWMMWHKARAQPSQCGADLPHLIGQSARCWRNFNFCFANVSRRLGAWAIRCLKLVEAKLGGRPATCMASRPGFGELLPQINGGAHSLL